jgi:hypothetical protein
MRAMTPARLALGGLVLLVAGIVIAWVGTSVALDVTGLVVGGIGSVALVSAPFLAVGQSEDRERERERQGR